MTDAAIQLGSEFLVNTNTANDQLDGHVAGLEGGGYVIVWNSLQTGAGVYTGIYGQRYDASGTPIGGEFQVHTASPYYQEEPAVTALVGGGFVVTWETWLQDGNLDGVYAQVFDASGVAVGGEFQVNTYTTAYQRNAEVTAMSDGGFVIVWQSINQEAPTSGYGVYAQRYDASGVADGGEIRVNSYTSSQQDEASVAALEDGGFIVTWQSHGQNAGRIGVYAQRYDDTGGKSGGEFSVQSDATVDRHSPEVAALVGGGFVITWESDDQDGDLRGVYAQIFDDTSMKVGGEFAVNSFTKNEQSEARVAGLPDGGFVVVWQSNEQDGSSGGVYGQRYDSNGAVIGGEFAVNSYTLNSQSSPDIAVNADGGFIVSWQSYNQDRAGLGIYAQQFDAALFGTADADTIIDNVGANLIEGQGGDDVLKGKGGKDYLYGSGGADTLYGGAKRDKLFGGAGFDTLYGGADNDVLKGNAGIDTLEGGMGKDTMFGGSGVDTFVFTDAAESATNSSADVIKDFESGTDFIDLSNMVSGLTFVGSAGFSGALEVRAVVSGSDVLVRVDVDGDGSADTKIVLEGVAGVTAADFIL